MGVDASRAAQATSGVGRDLPLRLISSLLLIAVALIGAWLGGWPAAIMIAAASVIVHVEWVGLSEPGAWPAIALIPAPAIGILVFAGGFPAMGVGIAAAAMAGAIAMGGAAWRPLGVAYASIFGFALLILRSSAEYGFVALVVLFAVVWATDSGGFFAGRLIGGPRLWPSVSPNKTWAGAAGGLAAGVTAAAASAAVLGVAVSLPLVAVLALLSITAQLGDLFESKLKRRFGAKDSGRLVPGHGGFMDRVDGLVFAAATAVVIGWLNTSGGDAAAGLLRW